MRCRAGNEAAKSQASSLPLCPGLREWDARAQARKRAQNTFFFPLSAHARSPALPKPPRWATALTSRLGQWGSGSACEDRAPEREAWRKSERWDGEGRQEFEGGGH